MFLDEFILFSVFLFLLYILTRRTAPKVKLPPGPSGLLLIGNVHQIATNPYRKLSEWARSYGKLYTIRLATKHALVISDAKLMKEIFGNLASTGKLPVDTYPGKSHGPRGIMNTEGDVWLEQRAFCLHTVNKIGCGQRLEHLLLHELHYLVDWIKREKDISPDGALNLGRVLQLASVNSLWTLVSGERISLDNREMGRAMADTFQSMIYTAKGGLMLFPWLKYMAQCISGHNQLLDATEKLRSYIKQYMDNHLKTFVEKQPRDLIDLYIEKIKLEEGTSESSFHGPEGREHAIESILEIFISGGETIAFTLNFLVLYLTQHPEIQEKLHDEVCVKCGDHEDPHIKDTMSIPYLEAVILETLRYSSLAPIGVMHKLLGDLQYDGYTLPKGVLLIANTYHVHHDEKIWGDPQNFRPERFLESGDKVDTLKENLVPFQAGRRKCPGERLSMEILEVFVAKFVQEFQVLPVPGVSRDEYMQPDVNYLLLPKKVKVIVKERC